MTEAPKADRYLIEAVTEESARWNPTDPVRWDNPDDCDLARPFLCLSSIARALKTSPHTNP